MTAPDSLPLHALAEDNLAAASPDLLRAVVRTFADALMSAVAATVGGDLLDGYRAAFLTVAGISLAGLLTVLAGIRSPAVRAADNRSRWTPGGAQQRAATVKRWSRPSFSGPATPARRPALPKASMSPPVQATNSALVRRCRRRAPDPQDDVAVAALVGVRGAGDASGDRFDGAVRPPWNVRQVICQAATCRYFPPPRG